jgi:hypothetical protein
VSIVRYARAEIFTTGSTGEQKGSLERIPANACHLRESKD